MPADIDEAGLKKAVLDDPRVKEQIKGKEVRKVIDAVNCKRDAVVRESADLLYNLTVLWASAGVHPYDVWQEMERREHMLGIAEKLPKSAVKMPKATTPARVARRPIVALESRALRKRH